MESRWKFFRKEPSSTATEARSHSKSSSARHRSQSVDRVLHSRATNARSDPDSDSVFGFTKDWVDMPSVIHKEPFGKSCINRAKSQSSVCYSEQNDHGTARLSRGREKVSAERSEHSGGSGVIKWLRNSFRRSRSRSNSRKDKNGKESEFTSDSNNGYAKTKPCNSLPSGKSKQSSKRTPASNVKNKVELFEQRSTKSSESSEVTKNLHRYSLIKAQQHGKNEQVLSAHQAALTVEGVITSATDSASILDTGGYNTGSVGDENVHNLVGMSSELSQPGTGDCHKVITGINGTHGGHVNKARVQLGTDGSSGLTGKGDVPGMSTGLRSDPSRLAPSNEQHVDHEKNTCKNSITNPALLVTQSGHGKQEHQINNKRFSLPLDGRSLPNYGSNSSHKKTSLTDGHGKQLDNKHSIVGRVIDDEGSESQVSVKSVDHRSEQPQYVTHAQVHRNSDEHQSRSGHSASKLSVERQVIRRTDHSRNIETVATGNVVDRGQTKNSELRGTAQVLNESHQVDSDYRNQLQSFGHKYFGSLTGSLQNINRNSPKCISGSIFTEDSPPPRPPPPLETHFDCHWERPASVCSSSTYSETMVSCKEAIQKATTIISRSKSPTKSPSPDEIASKIKAFEQLHREGSPATGDLSRAGSAASSSDISGSQANKSIISKIQNVGTHSSYFHASDITGQINTGPAKEIEEVPHDLNESKEAEKVDKEGTESSVWNESGSERVVPESIPHPITHSTPCGPKVHLEAGPKDPYKRNWNQLQGSSPSLTSQSNTQIKQRSTSVSSEFCTSSLTDTSTLDWNSCHDIEETTTGSMDFQGNQLYQRSASLSPNQYSTSTKKSSNTRVVEGKCYDTCSTPTSMQSDPNYENQKVYSTFDSETVSSENRSYEVLKKSDLMDESMRTKDLNVSTESRDTVTEAESKARYVKKRSKSQHNLHQDKLKSRRSREKTQTSASQNMWRSQSQPNVNQDDQLHQKRLQNQLGRFPSDSSLSSDWSSASSLDVGHLGNVVEAKIRGRTRGMYTVQGRHPRKSQSQGHLASRSQPRSQSRTDSRDRNLDGITKPEKNFILERWWATLGDIPATVDGVQYKEYGDLEQGTVKKDRNKKPFQNVSMATSVSFLPGVTPEDKLRLASSKGQLDKVKEYIIGGASFDPDKEGRTALHYAALNGFAECVQLIAAEGCEIDIQDNMGYTALHRAAAQGHLEVIKVLLAEGAIVDRQDEVHGNAALHEAAWNGYSRTLELLCKAKANVHLVNKAGFSALHLAAQNGHNQSGRVLLYAGASPDHRNNYGDTSLHTACRYGHAGVTRILISARCRINEQNKNGDTGLHIAAALKRRKITKLMVESGVDVNVRNKQNETAIDVAKRKEHSEIILIITSQPKTKKEKKKKSSKKNEKEKLVVEFEGEKKKKGFFFRKKSKTKDKEVKQQLYTAPSITAASEITTSHYEAHLPPHLMNQYRYQQQLPRSRTTGTLTGAHSGPPGSAGPPSVVSGVAGQYQPKNGVAVYRDLAGNIKQGPAGYTPVCNCGPLMKRLEQKMDGDRANMYDHIDASHRTLGDRVDHLDRRAAQQIYALDKLTRERIESERQDLQDRMEKRFLRERLESDRQMDRRGENIKSEIKAWVDNRLINIEQQYGNFNADCCDDLLHGRNHQHSCGGEAQPGALYRSKSDETLSISSTHPTKKHARLYAKAIHDLKKMRATGHKMDKRTRGIAVRDHPVGAQNGHCGRPLTFHEDLSPIANRSPEGHSGNGDFTEVDYHESMKFNSTTLWSQRKYNEAEGKSPSDSSSTNQLRSNFANMNIQEGKGVNTSDSSAPNYSGFPKVRHDKLSSSSLPNQPSYTMASFNDDCQHQGYNVRHFKTDSGSNPDSGYGGKAHYGRLINDSHNSSIGTTASTTTDASSPTTLASTSEGGSDALSPPQYYGNQREKWFRAPLQEVNRITEERASQDSDGFKSKIRAFEDQSNSERIRMTPAIASRQGTEV